MHRIAEDRCPCGPSLRLSQHLGEVLAMEDIVTEDQAHRIVSNEFLTEDEGIGQTPGLFLHLVGKLHPNL